jgi:predicted metal-binding protein
MCLVSALLDFIAGEAADVYAKEIRYDQIVFEQRIGISCYYCAKYGRNWRCPPHLPNLDFCAALSEYKSFLMVYKKFAFKDAVAYNEVRRESSLFLHKLLLKAERRLWDKNVSICASFIGGSCKLCKNGCDALRCANPAKARIPLEAIGINVVKTAENAGIDISFPPRDFIMRIGLLCW